MTTNGSVWLERPLVATAVMLALGVVRCSDSTAPEEAEDLSSETRQAARGTDGALARLDADLAAGSPRVDDAVQQLLDRLSPRAIEDLARATRIVVEHYGADGGPPEQSLVAALDEAFGDLPYFDEVDGVVGARSELRAAGVAEHEQALMFRDLEPSCDRTCGGQILLAVAIDLGLELLGELESFSALLLDAIELGDQFGACVAGGTCDGQQFLLTLADLFIDVMEIGAEVAGISLGLRTALLVYGLTKFAYYEARDAGQYWRECTDFRRTCDQGGDGDADADPSWVEPFDVWREESWLANGWCGNVDAGPIAPSVEDGWLVLAGDDYCWQEVMTEAEIAPTSSVEIVVVPELQSGGVNGDFGFVALADAWVYYGQGAESGIRFEEGTAWAYHRGNEPVDVSLGPFVAGRSYAIELAPTGDGSLEVRFDGGTQTLPAVDAARLVIAMANSVDGLAVDEIRVTAP